MNRATLEIVVGLFVLAGILCLGYLSVRLGKLELINGDHYRVSALFDSASGLRKGASVEMAGVDVGRVERVSLDPRSQRARVDLKIGRNVKLQEDVIASIRTRGIIGDKFIILKQGGSERVIPEGGVIRETESAVDLEELLSKYIHGQVE